MGKTYFASDFHLGTPDYASSLVREKKIVQWLESIEQDCETLFLLGDIFDFWFEYKTTVPKYFNRLLGKLASMTDAGIPIYFFKGNHDMWTFDYLEKEIGLKVIDEEWIGEIDGKKFYIHHGDALWKGEKGYKFIRKIFRSQIAIWLFRRLHPNLGVGFANYLSRKSRKKNSQLDQIEIPLKKEYQILFANEYSKTNSIDFFIFGHRHKPLEHSINNSTKMINLGDWVTHFTYATFENHKVKLHNFNP
jgi:UDP-2,3-diacylglucosamine hydrolase